MLKKLKNNFWEIIIFGFAFFVRFIRLDYPKTHIFDEVYHAFTAEQLVKWNPAAWEWWNPNPTGFAYEWTHPPLAKEFMVIAMSIFGDGSFAWRFFSALFGTGIIILIYFISLELFKNRKIAILASLVASLDGLLLVMSRIAMNDAYFLFFSLLAIFLFLKNKNLLMGIALGLAIASKWTGFLTVGIIGILFLFQNSGKLNWLKSLGILFFPLPFFFQNFKTFKFLLSLIIIPTIIYLTSYIPFFLQRHSPPGQNYSNFQTFMELQKQMWWYHTNLKATHLYQSTPYDWVFDLRPVWLFVNYPQAVEQSTFPISAPSPSYYFIRSGDTLWGIAQSNLGSGFRWKELKGYQGDPKELPVGTKIEIPAENIQPSKISVPNTNITKQDNKNLIANIYTLDNPLISWFGLVSIFILAFEFIKRKEFSYLVILLSYFGFFILWFRSPRIMFNYHYLASTAFLTIAIGFTLNKLLDNKQGKILFISFLILIFSLFIYFYPLWTGVNVPTDFNNSYFWLKSWK